MSCNTNPEDPRDQQESKGLVYGGFQGSAVFPGKMALTELQSQGLQTILIPVAKSRPYKPGMALPHVVLHQELHMLSERNIYVSSNPSTH